MKVINLKIRKCTQVIVSMTLIVIVSLTQTNGTWLIPEALSQSPWRRIKLEPFSFYLPPDMKQHEARARDSAVWKYSSKNLELTIDLGIYSERPLGLKQESEYREEHVRIDGKKAVMVFFRNSEAQKKDHPYVAAVYFSNLGVWKTKLSFFATCASPQEQKIARKIFLSIDLKQRLAKSYQRRPKPKVHLQRTGH